MVEAVERVRRDLDGTLGPEVVVIDVPPSYEGADAWIHVAGVHPLLVGVALHPGEPIEELVVRVADTAQDWIAESGPLWGRAWPACPLHPGSHHPLTPRAIEGDAIWTCSADTTAVASIGALGP
jgi:hypothetical protein